MITFAKLIYYFPSDDWADAEKSVDSCSAQLSASCSLYERTIDASYNCFPLPNATYTEVSDTKDLDCDTLEDDSIECYDLTSAQNAAAINIFIISTIVVIVMVLHKFGQKRSLVGIMLLSFMGACCGFISAASFRTYLDSASTIDIYYTAANGDQTKLVSLEVDWQYGSSWALTIVSGVISLLLLIINSYFLYTDFFNDKMLADTDDELVSYPNVTNTLGVPLVVENTDPRVAYEL